MTATGERVKSGEELDLEERERRAWAAYGHASPGRDRQRSFRRALVLTEELVVMDRRRREAQAAENEKQRAA